MNKKRTKAIRNFLALLVLLTTGGTQQVWAQTETLSDLDDAQIQLSYDGGTTYNSSDGTVTGVAHENYNSFNWCLMVEIRVNPKAGYITKLSQMTSNWNGDDPYTSFGNVREGDGDPYEGELVFVPYDPADDEASPLYGHYEAKRTILVYSKKKNPNNFAVKISFKYVGIFLQNKLGDNATVTFYEPNADFAPEYETFVFDPVAYTGNGAEIIAKKPADYIDNSDGNDHYVIAHIVPNPGYWTDRTLLMAYEAGGALARSRAPIVDPAYTLKLLQADTYDDAESNTKSRHDGAGWYYYKLPKEHNCTAGYKYSIINGFVVKHFSFSDDDSNATIAQDFDNNTVTVGRTTDDWTAVLTYDKFVWTFDGTIGAVPHVQSISIQKGGTELLNMTDAATIDILVDPNYTAGMPGIGNNDLKPSAGENGWFVGRDDRYSGQTFFIIEPQFLPVDPTQPKNTWGSPANPWAIASAADLNMLAKSVNVGGWTCSMQYFRQTEDIVYDDAANADFEPIGADNYSADFRGRFDGNGKTITGIDYTCTKPKDSDGTKAYVGLFGNVFGTSDSPSSVMNVTLVDCKFRATDASCAVAVGSVIASASGMGADNVVITGCKVLATSDGSALVSSLSDDGCATGAIVGVCSTYTSKLENNYYGYGVTVTNNSGTAKGYTKRGTEVVTSYDPETDTYTYVWDDITANDGAMLYVKKATVPSANANGSKVEFNEVTKGTDRYDKDGDDFYYAVGQHVTLTVTLGSRKEATDIRTFYDELTALTMNDGTTDTDIKDALGFTMPEADATITATIAESDWFTIPSNNKNWMSFYHEWKDASGASANYIVTDGDAASGTTVKTIEVKTVASVDPDAGTFTLADIQGGVSFSEMPTLFHYADKNDDTAVLPALLKFTPVSPTVSYTQPDKANQFKGTDTGKELAPLDKCYVLNNMGDFIFAYVTDGDNKIPAHHAYIDLEDNPYSARLLKVAGDGTGIDTILRDDSDAVGTWYSLDGRRLGRQPAKKGIYIYKGKKAVIK